MAFGGILVLFLAFASISLVKVRQAKMSLELLNTAYMPLTEAVVQLGSFAIKEERTPLHQVLTRGRVDREPVAEALYLGLLKPINESLQRAGEVISRFDRATTPRNEIKDLKTILEEMHGVRERFRQLANTRVLYADPAHHVTHAERSNMLLMMDLQRNELRRALNVVQTQIETKRQTLARSAENDQQEVVKGLIVFGAVLLLASASLIVWLGHILSPVSELIRAARVISTGNYHHRVPEQAGSEIGELSVEINRMASSIQDRESALRAQSEEIDRLRLFKKNIIESVRIGLIAVGEDGRVSFANRILGQMFQVDPDALTGRTVGELGFLCPRLDELDRRVEAARGGEVSSLGVGDFLLGDRHAQIEILCMPLRDDSEQSVGALVLFEDVTDREATKARLIRSERMAAIGRMTAQVTHEVRNPLATMSLNVEMLGDELRRLRGEFGVGTKGDEAERMLRSIEKEIQRLNHLTEEYLQFARLPSAPPQRMDVNEVVRETLGFYHDYLRQRGIEARAEFGEEHLEALVNGRQIRQVLANLINNAADAMTGGGRLRIQTATLNGFARIVFADTGSGIPPEDLEHIFEPFFTTKDNGTGLGLPLSRQIIEQLGGRMEADSVPGQGATFTIDLPRHHA